MEITGKLIEKTDVVSGTSKAGKPWQKIGFVLQIKGSKFPKQVYFETLNPEMIQSVSDTNLESEVKVWWDIASRQWKDKWITNATAFKMEILKMDDSFVIEQKDMNDYANTEAMKARREAAEKILNQQEVVEGNSDDLPF